MVNGCRCGPLLSQRQVNNLVHGERIMVIWCGGNGPHIYTVNRTMICKTPFALECNQQIDFVGKESYHTQVRRIIKEPR